MIALSAAEVSRQLRPAILPESSIKKIVSNCVRNAYGESDATAVEPGRTTPLDGGEYAGGASAGLGLLVGVGAENGLLEGIDLVCVVSRECASIEDGFFDVLDVDFLEPNFLKGLIMMLLRVEDDV